MKYKLDCSYLDDISKAVIDLDNAALTTYILTNIALKRAYDRIELSKEQIELFEADVKAAKLNGLWDFLEEEKTIENYINDKKKEWDIYSSITDKFKAEKELYFEVL